MTNWKNCIINDHTGKRPPSAQNVTQNETRKSATTDYQLVTLHLSDPYRIQNLKFYEI